MTRRAQRGGSASHPCLHGPSGRRGGGIGSRPSQRPEDEGRAALMPYMMAGFPDRESSLAVAAAYADSGADLIELGIPFSDPLADGPTIHAAATAALAAGATLETALEVCESVAERVPVVLMVYSNMVLAHGGAEEFARPALRPRAPPGRSSPTCRWARPSDVREAFAARRPGLVPLVAPTTSAERRARICAVAEGLRLRRLDRRHDRRAGRAAGRRWPSWSPRRRPMPRSRSRSASGSAPPRRRRRSGEIADGVIIGSRLVRAAAEAGSAAGRRRGGRRVPARDARRPRRVSSAPQWEWSSPSSWRSPRRRLLRLTRPGRPGRRPGLLRDPPDRRGDQVSLGHRSPSQRAA